MYFKDNISMVSLSNLVVKKLIISAICLLALAASVSSYTYYRSHQIVAKTSLAKATVHHYNSTLSHYETCFV